MQIPPPRWLLAAGIIAYTLIFSGISLWKYDALRYNARDLAIYNQVLWNLTNNESGITNQVLEAESQKTHKLTNSITHKLYSSLQGHNYLGDHFEPILLLLVPFYTLFPDPRTLLVFQTLALALAAIPLYAVTRFLIANDELGIRNLGTDELKTEKPRPEPSRRVKNWLPTIVGVLWLLHPAVQNADLFEFHSLAFAPLCLFFLFYFWQKIKKSTTEELQTDKLDILHYLPHPLTFRARRRGAHCLHARPAHAVARVQKTFTDSRIACDAGRKRRVVCRGAKNNFRVFPFTRLPIPHLLPVAVGI